MNCLLLQKISARGRRENHEFLDLLTKFLCIIIFTIKRSEDLEK